MQQANEKILMPIHFTESSLHILVTGATGFIGQLLIAALLGDRHRVTVLTREVKRAARLLGEQVRCIASMDELLLEDGVDVVINLAGARILGMPWTKARRAVLLQSRIGTTSRLIEWMKKAVHKPRIFLSASAIGYYGIQAKGDDQELSEECLPQSIFMSRLCQEWEAVAGQATALGIPVVVMRFGLVLGTQGALPMMLLPIKIGLGGRLGHGQQWISWIHVRDILRAMAHVWHMHVQEKMAPAVSIYNFTAPEAVSQLQFSQTAAAVLHRPCCVPTPAFPLRYLLGEQADLLFEGQRVIPQHLQKDGFSFEYPNLKGALEDLCGV